MSRAVYMIAGGGTGAPRAASVASDTIDENAANNAGSEDTTVVSEKRQFEVVCWQR